MKVKSLLTTLNIVVMMMMIAMTSYEAVAAETKKTTVARRPILSSSLWLFVSFGGFRGGPSRLPPLGRRTDAVTVLVISDNGTVLWATSISLMRSRHHVIICTFGHVS